MSLVIVGTLCFILPGILWGLFIFVSLRRSGRAIGTVVGHDAMPGVDGGSDLSAPIVEFQLPDGRKITFTEKIHSSENILDFLYELFARLVLKKDLDHIKVIYALDNPQKARVNKFSDIYIMPIVLIVFGLLITLYSVPVVADFIDSLSQ